MQKNTKKRIKKPSDILPKIFSVVAAILLWVYVVNVENTTEEITVENVPIEIGEFSADAIEGLTIVSGMDNKVSVDLKGPASSLKDISEEQLFASVNMSDVKEAGTYERKVEIGNLPKGVNVVGKSPNNIEVTVDRSVSKTFDVLLDLKYSKTDDYEITGTECDVVAITVTGPEKRVNAVDKAEVSVDLGKLEQNTNAIANIKLYDKSGKDLTANPYLTMDKTSAKVRVTVNKIVTEPEIEEKEPEQTNNAEDGADVNAASGAEESID